MVNILVTGATGQVGYQLVKLLAQTKPLGINNSNEIICYIRSPNKAKKLVKFGVTLVKGTLNDSDIIDEMFRKYKPEYVFHIAADIRVYASYDEIYQTNVVGTKNLLISFSEYSHRDSCFIFTSSIAVYETFLGESKKNTKVTNLKNKVSNENIESGENYSENGILIDEETPFGTINPKKDVPYSISKRLAEQLVEKYRREHPDLSFIITRLGPILGPGDRQIIPNFIRSIHSKTPKLINKGKDLIAVTSPVDVARAQIYLAEHKDELRYHIFNVNADHISYKEAFEIIAEFYNKRPPKFSVPLWLFKMLIPLLRFVSYFAPNNKTLQTILSPTTLNYIGKTFRYSNKRLLDTGFQFSVSAKEAILSGIEDFEKRKNKN